MVIFNSYVKLPEGKNCSIPRMTKNVGPLMPLPFTELSCAGGFTATRGNGFASCPTGAVKRSES